MLTVVIGYFFPSLTLSIIDTLIQHQQHWYVYTIYLIIRWIHQFISFDKFKKKVGTGWVESHLRHWFPQSPRGPFVKHTNLFNPENGRLKTIKVTCYRTQHADGSNVRYHIIPSLPFSRRNPNHPITSPSNSHNRPASTFSLSLSFLSEMATTGSIINLFLLTLLVATTSATSSVTCQVKCLDGSTLSLLCANSCTATRQICLGSSPSGGLVKCGSGISKQCATTTGVCGGDGIGDDDDDDDCKTSCLPGECGLVSDNCGGFISCMPCIVPNCPVGRCASNKACCSKNEQCPGLPPRCNIE